MNCLNDCNGACCKGLLIRVRGSIPADYAKARDIKMWGSFIWIAHPCKYLTETGRCSIHATKPPICASQDAGCEECLACREILKTER